MISVDEAYELVKSNCRLLSPVLLPLEEAFTMALAENVYAGINIPPFDQSAMDGYAFSFSDWNRTNRLTLGGVIPAGISGRQQIASKQAMRIFTGAPIPGGADTVVIQEKTRIENGELVIHDEQLSPGNNVRKSGSEIKSGSLAMEKLSVLHSSSIGFLAGIGIREVSCYPMPSVSIIVTGNELQQPGNPLLFGQVYESNSYSLKAALQQMHIAHVQSCHAGDDPNQLETLLNNALQNSDLILLTGGVSVGDYDFVLETTERCGIHKIFHKVRQKPGKPLFFGKKENKIIFGLPGNPGSVLTCFYEYVVPAIESLTGKKNLVKRVLATLNCEYIKNSELTYFLKGFAEGDKVMPLEAQESYRLSSFVRANCLIRLNEQTGKFKPGTEVEIHLLPGN